MMCLIFLKKCVVLNKQSRQMEPFTEWVKRHSTCGLTEPLDFSKYDRFVDSWSITVDGETITNPSLDQVVELYTLRVKRAFIVMRCKECGNEFSAKRIGNSETFAFDMAQIQTSHCCTVEHLERKPDN